MNGSPWTEAPYVDAAEKTALGGLSFDAFLSLVINTLLFLMLNKTFICMQIHIIILLRFISAFWFWETKMSCNSLSDRTVYLSSFCSLTQIQNLCYPNLWVVSLQWSQMTLLEPARSVEHLIYIGFPGDPSSAIRLTRRRRLDRKKQQCERKVFQCFVFGPNNAGKSALLNCFLGRFVIWLALTETCCISKIQSGWHIHVVYSCVSSWSRSYADNPGSNVDERYAVNMVDESGVSGISYAACFIMGVLCIYFGYTSSRG